MLSTVAHELTTLVLARHILIAQAIEADARYEYLAAMHEPPFDRLRPSWDEDETITRKVSELLAQLQLFPSMLLDLEQRIHLAWQTLQRVRPA
jgi:hypothetical protein